jgi:mono/diheme cytochrome c family protein
LRSLLTILLLAGVTLLAACDSPEPLRTDAELGLNPTQARGHHIFDHQCASCHYAYTNRGLKGPTLHDLYKKQSMTNGMPVNDERVRDVITYGHGKMPAFNRALTPEQIDVVIEYLRTL